MFMFNTPPLSPLSTYHIKKKMEADTNIFFNKKGHISFFRFYGGNIN